MGNRSQPVGERGLSLLFVSFVKLQNAITENELSLKHSTQTAAPLEHN